METELGEIMILVNGLNVNYDIVELPKSARTFHVNARYRLEYYIPEELLNSKLEVKCLLKNKCNMVLKRNIESGENLALISFYFQNIKLSIGTKGDREGIEYKYLENGIQLKGINMLENPFYVAWLHMKDRDSQENYTWFAADPSFDNY